MIGLNPLKTRVLITSDEVIFHAPTDNNTDPRTIINNIIIAERRFIKPMIGDELYSALIDKKNKVVTNDNKAVLTTALNEGRGDDREQIELHVGDYVNSDSYLDENQKFLWENYLHKIVAECVYFVSIPVNRTRFTAEGMQQNNPASIASANKSASVELKDIKHLMDRSLQDRIAPLMEDMHQYLCKSKFPGYTKDCGCNTDGIAYRKKSDIILSMYDDDENCNCR